MNFDVVENLPIDTMCWHLHVDLSAENTCHPPIYNVVSSKIRSDGSQLCATL